MRHGVHIRRDAVSLSGLAGSWLTDAGNYRSRPMGHASRGRTAAAAAAASPSSNGAQQQAPGHLAMGSGCKHARCVGTDEVRGGCRGRRRRGAELELDVRIAWERIVGDSALHGVCLPCWFVVRLFDMPDVVCFRVPILVRTSCDRLRVTLWI